MAITADVLKSHFGFNDPNVIQGILNDPSQVARYEREYGGGNPTPTSGGQVTDFLNIYQKNLLNTSTDPALQSLVSTYAPNLTPLLNAGAGSGGQSGYVIKEEYAGKSLKQIRNEGNLAFRPDVLAAQLGIDENKALSAEDIIGLGSLNLNDSGSAEVQNFKNLFGTYSPPAPEVTETGATSAAGLPQPINRVEEFLKLRQEMGVTDMESFLVDLKAEQEFLYAEMRARTNRERGEIVPQGVIEGRIGKIEQQQMERIDNVRRLIATATDQLNVAYGVISTYINYMGQDYEDAVNAYNDNFNRAITIYGLITDAKKTQLEEARFRTQLQVDQIQYEQNIASANLQTMINAVTSGNLNYSDLPSEQKSMIMKLEAQAGLPVGFTSSLKMNPKDQVLFQSSNEGITQVGFIQPDGSVRVEKYGTRISSGGKSVTEQQKELKQNAFVDARNFLNERGGDDGYVSPEDWNAVKSEWIQADYSAEDFDNAFRYKYVGDTYRSDGTNFDQFNITE